MSKVSEKTPSRHSCITALLTLLSFLCSPFCLPCSLFGCRCPFLGSIHAFPSSLHAFPGSLYAFLGPSCSANPPGRPAWSAGGTFYLTRRSFRAPKTSTTRG